MEKWLLGQLQLRPAIRCVLVTLTLSGCLYTIGFGQQYFTGETTYGIKLGKTKPLHQYYAIPPTDPDKLKALKANKPPKFIPNFVGRRHKIRLPCQQDLIRFGM